MNNAYKYVEEQVERFKDATIEIMANVENVLVIKFHPNCSGWGTCYFNFINRDISCSGDIESFTLNTTWNTREKILKGTTPKSINYLFSKMANGNDIQQFDYELVEETAKKIYKERTNPEWYTEEEIKKFKEKYDEYNYLLGDVCDGHLNYWDEWCEELGIEDSWEYYDRFYDYPTHAYIMLAMLRVIEDKLKEELENVDQKSR